MILQWRHSYFAVLIFLSVDDQKEIETNSVKKIKQTNWSYEMLGTMKLFDLH